MPHSPEFDPTRCKKWQCLRPLLRRLKIQQDELCWASPSLVCSKYSIKGLAELNGMKARAVLKIQKTLERRLKKSRE